MINCMFLAQSMMSLPPPPQSQYHGEGEGEGEVDSDGFFELNSHPNSSADRSSDSFSSDDSISFGDFSSSLSNSHNFHSRRRGSSLYSLDGSETSNDGETGHRIYGGTSSEDVRHGNITSSGDVPE